MSAGLNTRIEFELSFSQLSTLISAGIFHREKFNEIDAPEYFTGKNVDFRLSGAHHFTIRLIYPDIDILQ